MEKQLKEVTDLEANAKIAVSAALLRYSKAMKNIKAQVYSEDHHTKENNREREVREREAKELV